MGMFNNNLEIDMENPFKYDRLEREEEIKNLTSLFDVVDNQMVLSINSQWGTGKTSFLRMWNQHLKNEGYKTIFFNAWENDYVEEPFIAFVDEIRDSINDENKIKGFMEKAKDVGLALVKQSPKIVLKAIKNKTGVDSEEIISDDELSKMVSDKIDNYNKNKKSVKNFKETLEKIAFDEFKENNKPIIIFVDELDRCRPDYAINLLERIKHFFSVKNMIFILGIDKEELSNSIRVIYGEQTDINGYLTRFIDLEYKIKQSNNEQYVNYLMDKFNFVGIFEKGAISHYRLLEDISYNYFLRMLIQVVTGFKLSLRDIEKFIVEIYMILKVNNRFPIVLIILCVVKKINRDVYDQIKERKVSYEELILKLKQINNNIQDFFEKRENSMFKAYLIWLLDDVNEIKKIKEIVKLNELGKQESKVNHNKDIEKFLEKYESIALIEGNKMETIGAIETKEKIFKMAELYDNFMWIDSQK